MSKKSPTLTERVEALEGLDIAKRLRALKISTARHQTNLNNIHKTIKKHDKRLKNISPHEIEGELDRLRPRVLQVDKEYALLIEKTTVLSEVVYWTRVANPESAGLTAQACIWAMDAMDDAWWQERMNYTIEQWFTDIMEQWKQFLVVQREKGKMTGNYDGSVMIQR